MAVRLSKTPPFFSRCFRAFGSLRDQTGARLVREKLQLPSRGAPPFIFGLPTLSEVKPNAENNRTDAVGRPRWRPAVPVLSSALTVRALKYLHTPKQAKVHRVYCLGCLRRTAPTGRTPCLLVALTSFPDF